MGKIVHIISRRTVNPVREKESHIAWYWEFFEPKSKIDTIDTAIRTNEESNSIYRGDRAIIPRIWYLILVKQINIQARHVVEFTTTSIRNRSGVGDGMIKEIIMIFKQFKNTYEKTTYPNRMPLKINLIIENCTIAKIRFAKSHENSVPLAAIIVNGMNAEKEPIMYALLGETQRILRAINNRQQ